MNKHEKIHGGECCSPQLIQTLDAHLHGNGGYFPPGQNIPVSLPLDPKSDLYKEVWHEPGDVIYASSINHPHYFHREPDGKLTLSSKENEPDSTIFVDIPSLDRLTHQLYIPIFAIDQQNNFYAIGKSPMEIAVYTKDLDVFARFKLVGRWQCWYLNAEGVMCVITSNLGIERARKNILRVYRLNLPVR